MESAEDDTESQVVPDSVGFLLGFPPDLFRDHGTYYELNFAQRTPQWHAVRKQRITASIFGAAAGFSPYKTRNQLLFEMAGLVQPADFAFFQRMAMKSGEMLEPYVRDLYETQYHKKVASRGLVIPKWCTRIGVSVDGYIINPEDGRRRSKGIIEIKCPMNMYPELVDNSHRIEKGEKFDPLHHEHIKPDHYAQMQGGMAILDVDYCDYIVYVAKTKDLYVTRVPRNRNYWDHELYPQLLSFLEELDKISVKLEKTSAKG